MCPNRPRKRGDGMSTAEFRTELPVTASQAFAWHAWPGAFERLSPPWARVEILESRGGIESGARRVLRLGTPPFAVRWVAVHRDTLEGRRFVDVQESGPFSRWTHEHIFEDAAPGRSVLVDRIDYELPVGTLGERIGGAFARRRLERLFRYRGAITAGDLQRHGPFLGQPPLRVAITGASGLIGRQLAAFLTAGGHEVLRFARGRTALDGEIR